MRTNHFKEQLVSKQSAAMCIDELSPRVVLSNLFYNDREIFAIRDDLLPGGTKQRACAQLLNDFSNQGITHFVYASPFSGFAQVALAYVCQKLNLRCTLFCEQDHGQSGFQFHKFSLLAKQYGADIYLEHSLTSASRSAQSFTRNNKNSVELPLGFDCPEFHSALKQKISVMWQDIFPTLHQTPKNLWVPVGSGTLAKTLRRVIPTTIRLQCVNVQVLPEQDPRLASVRNLENIHFHQAPETFPEPCLDRPEIPSNIYYDAKLWSFIKTHAQDGDLWWNVAR